MQQHEFGKYQDYIDAQCKLTRGKIERGNVRCFTSPFVVEAIRQNHPHPVERGMCHGVRYGEELDMFERELGGRWIGTEIVPELCDGQRIIRADFSDVRNSWIGEFDMIYSNSLDHARDPYKTLKAWIACLSPVGWLYIEWGVWHGKLGQRENKADCFAATEDECLELVLSAGRLCRTIGVCSPKYTRKGDDYNCVVFCVR